MPTTLPTRAESFRRILTVALPLIMATSGHALRLFADRVMLSQYSPDALAATMPAGLTAFCFMALFIGTAGYASTFVAQFVGAGQQKEAGSAVWQAIWIACIGGILVGAMAPFTDSITTWMQHGPAVQFYQSKYFEVLVRLSFSAILLAAVNAFWSGQGKTRIVMCIELGTAGINILLNHLLIFGKYGFPELGIEGAGLATGLSSMAGCAVAFILFLSPNNRKTFGTWPQKRFNPKLWLRILKYGLPNGIQFSLELIAFNLFVIFLGRFGAAELAAANISFGLNALAFLPLVGLGMATSILVGQCIGADIIPLAKRYVLIAIMLSIAYNLFIGGVILAAPRQLISLFMRVGDPTQAEVIRLSIQYTRFIAAYLFFDGFFIIFSHAIRGAGDTRFAMLAGLVLSWVTLAIPAWFLQKLCTTATPMWLLLICHVTLASIVFFVRYRQGKWTSMQVIEKEATYEVDGHAEVGAGG